MKEIPLTRGFVAIVDDEDYDEISKVKWYCHLTGYAVRTINGKKGTKTMQIKMHREIMQAPNNMEVDHINGNRADNGKINLRLATKAENRKNRRHQTNAKRSIYKGVAPKNGKWNSRIYTNGKRISLGSFQTEQEAALVYNKAALKHYGEFAKLNEI